MSMLDEATILAPSAIITFWPILITAPGLSFNSPGRRMMKHFPWTRPSESIGALGDPRVPDNRHARDILLGTRFELDLYVNYRPVRLLDDRLCPLKDRGMADVNFVVFRENTEGLYVGIGGRFKAGTDDEIAMQEEVNTYKGVHRIIRHAFEYAQANGRRRVCMADKSNAMHRTATRCGSVSSARSAPNIRRLNRGISTSTRWCCFWSRIPSQFDVIVTNNLFGDIITDLGAALQGGLGHRRVGQSPSRKDVAVRTGARVGTAAGGEERRESDGRHPLGGSDARLCGPRRPGPCHRCGRAAGGPRRQGTSDIGGSLGTRETGDQIARTIRANT